MELPVSFHAEAAFTPEKPMLIVQLTDLHLPAQQGQLVAGVDTDETLTRVMQALLTLLPRKPDLLLATGDIADTGSRDAYHRFLRYMQPYPLFALPGNHDRAQPFFDVCRGYAPQWVDLPGWRIVMLNSSIEGRDEGLLGVDQVKNLHHALSTSARHVLVVLHHHPKPIASPWLDKVMLQNPADLFNRIDRCACVRAVLCGHVHQENCAPHGVERIPVISSPSTAFQFAPRTDDYQLDTLGPGFRWLLLHAQGQIETGVHYLNDPNIQH